MDDDATSRLQRARKMVEDDDCEQEHIRQLREEDKRQKAMESRFARASQADVLYMWEHACNEYGEALTEFEFQALCEAWVRAFDFYPPDMDVEYDLNNPPPPAPSKRNKPKPNPRPNEEAIEDADDDTMLSAKEVLKITGMSMSTFKRKRKNGEMPEPHQISERRIGWTAGDIRKVVEDMRKARRGRR